MIKNQLAVLFVVKRLRAYIDRHCKVGRSNGEYVISYSFYDYRTKTATKHVLKQDEINRIHTEVCGSA